MYVFRSASRCRRRAGWSGTVETNRAGAVGERVAAAGIGCAFATAAAASGDDSESDLSFLAGLPPPSSPRPRCSEHAYLTWLFRLPGLRLSARRSDERAPTLLLATSPPSVPIGGTPLLFSSGDGALAEDATEVATGIEEGDVIISAEGGCKHWDEQHARSTLLCSLVARSRQVPIMIIKQSRQIFCTRHCGKHCWRLLQRDDDGAGG